MAKGGLDQSSIWDRVRVGGSSYTVERAKAVMTKFALDAINISNVYENNTSKDLCGLCRCYYERQSLANRVPNHRILDLQTQWNYSRQGRRYSSASFLYSSAKVCLFCAQLFSDVPEVETYHASSSLSEGSSWTDAIEKKLQKGASGASVGSVVSEISSAVSEMNLDAEKTRDSPIKAAGPVNRNNIALFQKTYQSSVVDGYSPSNAIEERNLLKQTSLLSKSGFNGKSKAQSVKEEEDDTIYTKKMFCKTRREADPWWEIDWGLPQNIHSISFKIGKKSPSNLLEINVLLLKAPTGFEDPFLDSAIRKAVATRQFFTTCAEDSPLVELFEWALPTDARPVAIRIQLRGVGTLKIAQFIALQGDGVINAAFTEGDLRRYAGSFATLAPKAMKEGFVEIRSQLRNKKKVDRAPAVGTAHFDSAKIIRNVKEVEDAIRLKRGQIEEWLARVRDCVGAGAAMFSEAEMRLLYSSVFAEALQSSEDRRYDEYRLDEETLFDEALLEGYPRCDLRELFLKLRALLLRIQNKTHAKVLGLLMENQRLCKIADDPSEWLQALKVQLDAVNDHWDRFYKKPQKPTIVAEDRRGCSWSQFIVIIAYAVFRSIGDIPLAAFGISPTCASDGRASTSPPPSAEGSPAAATAMTSTKVGAEEIPDVLRKSTADPRVPKKSFAFAKYKLDRFSKRVLAEPSFPERLEASFKDLDEYAARSGQTGGMGVAGSPVRAPTAPSRAATAGSLSARLAASPTMGAAGSRVSSPMHNTRAVSSSPVLASVFDSSLGGEASVEREEVQEMHRLCGLCALKFAKSGVENKVMKKHLINLRLMWGIKNVSSAGEEIDCLEQSISLYNLIYVCNFCAQFFHPDSPCGISLPPSEKYVQPREKQVQSCIPSRSQTRRDLTPFYDFRYQIPEKSWRKRLEQSKVEALKAIEGAKTEIL